MNHLTNIHLQEYVDRLLDETATKEVEAHLSDCEECSVKVASFRRLEGELRRVRLERVAEDFTVRVMRVIRLGRSFGLARDVLLNLVPLGIGLIVTAVLIGIFAGPEFNQALTAGKSSQVVESLNEKVGGAIASGISIMLDWMNKAIGLSAAMPVIRDAAGLVLLFLVIKLFDEFVFLPIMKKRS